MSFPRYASYKDSGVEWLGEVPGHWDVVRLKTLLMEVDERAEDQDLELLGLSKALGVVKRSDLEQSASESDNYAKYKIASAGQLVMNKMQAWNGVFGLSRNLGMVSPDYAVFHFIKHGFADFLCALFRTEIMAGVFFTRCRGMGTAFLRLNTNDLLDIKVPLPTLEDATRISAFLDRETAKIDALIAEQQRLIELLKEKRQAVISHAVTKGLNPNARMKDSGIEWLGEVPEHWKVGKCRFYLSILSGFAFPSVGFTADESDIKLLRGINVSISKLKWDETVYWRRTEDDGLDIYEMKAGDLVIGMDRPLIGQGIRVAKVKSASPTKRLCLTAFPTPHDRLLRDGYGLRRPGRPRSLVQRPQGRFTSFADDSTDGRDALQSASGRRSRATLRRTARPSSFRGA